MLCIAVVSVIRAWAVDCGDTLTGGSHTLAADLDCSAYTAETGAVIVRDGAQLNLNGYRLTAPATGIAMEGGPSQVYNGVISAAQTGVHVAGQGGHLLQYIEFLDDPDISVYVTSPGNLVDHNRLGTVSGLVVESDGNTITWNVVSSADTAYLITGDRNRFRFNTIGRSLLGVRVVGDENDIRRNTLGTDAVEPGSLGLEIRGAGNWIIGNVIRHYDVDLFDANGECQSNTYRRNDIDTADPPCAAGPTFDASRRGGRGR
jgi:hypothetical protein